MTRTRTIAFAAAALLAGGATTALCFAEANGLGGAGLVQADRDGIEAVDDNTRPIDILGGGKPWLTAIPGGAQALRGKVLVVNFWTYSCINSLRALPYLRAWDQRYRNKGLVVVGVHAPEFGFERDPANVKTALAQLDLRYPNLQDNDYSVWRKLGNRGWPGFYFVDAAGRVRGYRLGEGRYDEAEELIRKLLKEAGRDPGNAASEPVRAEGIEAQADWSELASPEAYLGYSKARNFASPGGVSLDAPKSYAQARNLSPNEWDMRGTWTVGQEFATLDGSPGSIRYRFHARDVHLVLAGAARGHPIRFRVKIDGASPGTSRGTDIDADGWGEVTTDRLYQLVRQKGEVVDHTIEIEFSKPGVRAYVFTFG